MSAQFWIFLGAVSGGLAVIAGAIGAHALGGVDEALMQAFRTAQVNHAIHSVALVAVGLLLLFTQGRGAGFAGPALQAAAAAFAIGMILFCGGIYAHTAGLAFKREVPIGGMFLIAGWAALAIGSLGLRP
jgi:uncharacterized membrane protein YgdD (TMEM256/DUF423 family)